MRNLEPSHTDAFLWETMRACLCKREERTERLIKLYYKQSILKLARPQVGSHQVLLALALPILAMVMERRLSFLAYVVRFLFS